MMDFARRLLTLTLVITVSLLGFPFPGHAAERDSPPLLIDGQPLLQFLSAPATADRLPPLLAGLRAQERGQIGGMVVDADGQPMADHTVRLQKIVIVGGSRSWVMSGRDHTDQDGRFLFTGLQANEYLIEVLDGDKVLASASTTLTDGTMQVSGVVLELAEDTGMPVAAKIGIGVGIGVGVFLLVAYALFKANGVGNPFGGRGRS